MAREDLMGEAVATASAPARRQRAGPAAATVLVAMLAMASACGARDGPFGPDEQLPVEQATSSGGIGSPTGPPTSYCARCDGQVECGHCYIQAEENTFRCPPQVPMPVVDCMNLDERHTDASGAEYTCYYCQ